MLDIANKTLLQCFLMDSEMFVGEQRFAEKTILEFMEFFRPDHKKEANFSKVSQYVKGMKATLNPNLPKDVDDDPDAEENKKFDKQRPIKEEEYVEEDGEVDPEEEEKKEEESEEESDEDEDESDEFDDDAPEHMKGSVFESQAPKETDGHDVSVEFGNTMQSMLLTSVPPKNTLLDSLPPVNKSYVGKSNLSFFGRKDKKEEEEEQKKPEAKKKDEEEDEDEDEEEDDDEEEEDDDEEEESDDEEEQGVPSSLFGGKDKREARKLAEDAKQWQSLEMSSLTHNQTVNNKSRREFLKNRADQSAIAMNDMSVVSTSGKSKVMDKSKIIDKGQKASNTMKGDSHNVFNKSKIADNTTMKLEYDDDDEANQKYRL